jgi:hypothetical protein
MFLFHNQGPKVILAELERIRNDLYEKRRNANLKILIDELQCLESKVRFIKAVVLGRIKIFLEDRAYIIKQLQDYRFPTYKGTFEVYLDLRVSDFTTEKVADIQRKIDKNKRAVDILLDSAADSIWETELNRLKS